MVTAAVGFHCPDCARAGSRRSRTVIARDMSPGPNLTMALIAVNVAVYLFDLLGSGSGRNGLWGKWVLWEPAVANGEWWRLVTSGFLHAGLLHLAFNMFALYTIGTYLERIVGAVRYLAVYLASLAGGSLGVVLLSDGQPTVGASGAIFGIFGAFALLSLSRGISPMETGIGSTILLNLFITFTVPGISIGGHLGGLAIGALGGALLFGVNPRQAWEKAQQPTPTRDVLLLVAAGVGCLLLAIALSTTNAPR